MSMSRKLGGAIFFSIASSSILNEIEGNCNKLWEVSFLSFSLFSREPNYIVDISYFES